MNADIPVSIQHGKETGYLKTERDANDDYLPSASGTSFTSTIHAELGHISGGA